MTVLPSPTTPDESALAEQEGHDDNRDPTEPCEDAQNDDDMEEATNQVIKWGGSLCVVVVVVVIMKYMNMFYLMLSILFCTI